jgi:hypothetical protein
MTKRQLGGFGYDSAETTQRFVVTHPKRNQQHAICIEHCINDHRRLVARLSWLQWIEIAQPVAATFNMVLMREDVRIGHWSSDGETVLRHTFGKELLLLAWAIEDAAIERIPHVLDNWRGLAPEERWWLCTQSNATFGTPEHAHNQGWRMAIKYALGAL